MQIVIDISDRTYNDIMFDKQYNPWKLNKYEWKIANGSPLPKGHGRLIDADRVLDELCIVSKRPVKSQLYIIREAPTIIEADKGSGK